MPIDVTVDGISIEVNEVQLEKALSRIAETDDGITIDVNEIIPAKAYSSIDVKEVGIMMCLALFLKMNTYSLIVGIDVDFHFVEESNPLIKMSETEDGIVIDCNESHFWKAYLSIIETDEGTSIKDNDLQFEKADSQIAETEDGIIIDFNEVHPMNEHLLIDETVVGIEIDVNEEHLWKANSSMVVTNVGTFKCSSGWISTVSPLITFTARGSLNEQKYGMLLTILFPSRLHGFEIFIDDKELHPENAWLEIYETEEGIVIDVNEEQHLNVW